MSERKLIWTEEELPQGSDAWLDWRSGLQDDGSVEMTLGGSEIAGLLYLSPWTLPIDIYNEKLGLAVKEFSDDQMDTMNRGTRLESTARRHYEKQEGVSARQLCAIHPEHSWMRTSLDGITEDNKVILEIKSPKSLDNHIKQTKSGRVPDYRYPQMQWQLAVMRAHFEGVERVDYVSFWAEENEDLEILSTDLKIIKVYPNEDFIKELIRRGKRFVEHLRTATPPRPTLFLENVPLVVTYPKPRRKKEDVVPIFF